MVTRLCDPRGVRPAIRISPVPAVDPPFDDEPFAWSDADQLTLPWRAPAAASLPPVRAQGRPQPEPRAAPMSTATGPPGVQPGAPPAGSGGESPGRSLGAPPARSCGVPAGGSFAVPPAGSLAASLSGLALLAGMAEPGRTPAPIPAAALAGASTEARGAAHRFLTRSLEILNGYRPIGHLRAVSALMEAPTILTGAGAAMRTIGRYRQAAGLPPVAGRRPLSPAGRVHPRRLRVCEPRPGVAEASAVLTTAGRTWALAYRLELLHGRWLATAFTPI